MRRHPYFVSHIGGHWYVIYGTRRDPDLTDAFRRAVARRALSTQKKIATFFQRFLNFHCFEGEPPDAFIRERVEIARTRIDLFLESLGYEIADGDREDEAHLVMIGNAGSISALSCCLKALTLVYTRLAKKGLRPKANPGRVDHWHTMPLDERRDMAEAVRGKISKYNNYTGSQYVVTDAPTYAVRMEDPIGLGKRVLDAGRAFGWPTSIIDQVTVIDDDGGRWVDTFDINAADWALASRFGRELWAPNKSSKGVRVKTLVIRLGTVDQLRQSFDDDPNRPNMNDLEEMLERREWTKLKAIPLFPSELGTPYSYHVFNNDYFRPAMTAGKVEIRSETSIARATVHRLRAARIQEEGDHIYRGKRTDREIEVDEDNLRNDVHIRSKKAFERYIGPLKQKRAEAMKANRTDAREQRQSNPAPAVNADGRVPSPTEIRIGSLR